MTMDGGTGTLTATRDEGDESATLAVAAPDRVAGADDGGERPEQRVVRSGGSRRRRILLLVAIAVILVPVVVFAVAALSLSLAWRGVERETYDAEAFQELPPVLVSEAIEVEGGEELPAEAIAAFSANPTVSTDPAGSNDAGARESGGAATSGDPYDTYMVVGSDKGDLRADVIILVLVPTDGGPPLMVSLPRDLYLPNRCTQGLTRINANFAGCGTEVNGPTQLSGAVADFTGLEVDHFVLFTMEGFAAVIDELGGVEVCVEHPVRDRNGLDLPAGCTLADSEMALAWVRSRTTQEFVNGQWRTMPGVSDLTRNQRQQDLILLMLGRASALESPRQLTSVVSSLGDAFVLDDRLGMNEAVDLVWDNRNVRPGSVIRMTIPVQDYTTAGGAQVLLPTVPFNEVLAAAES